MLSKNSKMSQPHTKKPPTAGPPPRKATCRTNEEPDRTNIPPIWKALFLIKTQQGGSKNKHESKKAILCKSVGTNSFRMLKNL
jgi:hypothetical protein